jgi:HK97 family phage portal protein
MMGIGPWTSRPGPPSSPAHYTDEGWIPTSWPINFGQVGYDPIQGGVNSVAYSCIMLYARTIAQLPGNHQRMRDDNGVDTVRTSALARILLKPNNYQTQSHFMTNMVNALLWEGNAYALAVRNERQEVASIHQLPSKACRVYYAVPSEQNEMLGEVFYSVGGNPLVHFENDPAYRDGRRIIVPQRDMLHICGPSRPEDPMKGTSPLEAGAVPLAVSTGAGVHFSRYFQNMSRPSGVLSTDKILTGEQVTELRKRWSEHSMGENIGGVPILTAGLKWEAMSISAQEAQIAESQKMATADIARLFGVPLAMINDMSQATFSNTEQLIMVWLRQGLGYYINHIELAYDQLFAIERALEYTEFNVDALLRPDFKTRVEGLARGVQTGIYSPNEARKREGLEKAEHGDEPRVQQQQVPLDWGGFEVQPTPPPAPSSSAPAPAEPAPAEPASEERNLDQVMGDVIRRSLP